MGLTPAPDTAGQRRWGLSSNYRAWNNRGNAHARRGNRQQAIADYTRAIRLNPAYLHPYVNRGVAHRQNHHYDRAVGNFTPGPSNRTPNSPGHTTTAPWPASSNAATKTLWPTCRWPKPPATRSIPPFSSIYAGHQRATNRPLAPAGAMKPHVSRDLRVLDELGDPRNLHYFRHAWSA
jgi:tetratricopeptide (TPR) repeat protein